MRAALLAWMVVGLWGCTPGPSLRAADFPDDPPSCIGDDDCVLSGFRACCACPGEPRVWSRVELAAAQDPCRVVECAAAAACPPPSRARRRVTCDHGRCVARR